MKPDPAPCLSYLNSMKAVNDVFLTFLFYNLEDLTEPIEYEGVSVTVTPLYPVDSFPKIITISFDSSGVLCPDNEIRKGTMICRLNSRWNEHPSKVDITFDRFFIGDINTSGYFSCISRIENDSLVFTYHVMNGKMVTSNDSASFNFSVDLIPLSLKEGRSLNPFSWHTTGVHDFSGKDMNNKPFSVNITNDLYFDVACNNGEVTRGILVVMPDAASDYTADFGNGECDKKLVITFNGNSFPVSF